MAVTVELPTRRPLMPPEELRGIGERTAATVRARTRSGVGADGRTLRRREDGRPSTLTETGRLLDSLRVEVRGSTASVVATVPYAEHVQRDRPFLGLTPSEVEQLARTVGDGIAERAGAVQR